MAEASILKSHMLSNFRPPARLGVTWNGCRDANAAVHARRSDAEAQQVGVPRRAVRFVIPNRKKQRAFEQEPVRMR